MRMISIFIMLFTLINIQVCVPLITHGYLLILLNVLVFLILIILGILKKKLSFELKKINIGAGLLLVFVIESTYEKFTLGVMWLISSMLLYLVVFCWIFVNHLSEHSRGNKSLKLNDELIDDGNVSNG